MTALGAHVRALALGRREVGKEAGLKSVRLYVSTPLEGIYQVMQLQAGPDSVLLQSDDELQDFTNHPEASIIGEPLPPWVPPTLVI